MKTNSFMFFRTFIRSKLWIHAPHDSPFCLDSMSQRSWKSGDSTQKIRIHTYPHTFSRNFPGIEVPCRLQRILQLILRFTLRLEHMAGKPKTKAPGRFRWSDPDSGHPRSQSLWIDVDGHFSEWLLAQTFSMTQMQYDIIWHHMTSYDLYIPLPWRVPQHAWGIQSCRFFEPSVETPEIHFVKKSVYHDVSICCPDSTGKGSEIGDTKAPELHLFELSSGLSPSVMVNHIFPDGG